jgi:hypothetical protein
MATVTQAGITFNTTAGDKTVVATPAVNDLIVVVAAATGPTGSLGCTDNNSSGTYTLIEFQVQNGIANPLCLLVRTALITSASSTTWTTSGESASSGGGLVVYRVSGMTRTGASAVKTHGGNNAASTTTPAVALGAAALTGNALIGAVFNATNVAGVTQPSTWTQDNNVGYNTPTAGLESTHINSGFTGSTVTWGSTSASAFAVAALQLDTTSLQTFDTAQGEVHSDPSSLQVLDRASMLRSAFRCIGEKWERKSGLWVPQRQDIWVPA